MEMSRMDMAPKSANLARNKKMKMPDHTLSVETPAVTGDLSATHIEMPLEAHSSHLGEGNKERRQAKHDSGMSLGKEQQSNAISLTLGISKDILKTEPNDSNEEGKDQCDNKPLQVVEQSAQSSGLNQDGQIVKDDLQNIDSVEVLARKAMDPEDKDINVLKQEPFLEINSVYKCSDTECSEEKKTREYKQRYQTELLQSRTEVHYPKEGTPPRRRVTTQWNTVRREIHWSQVQTVKTQKNLVKG